MDEPTPSETAIVAYEHTIAQIDELQSFRPTTKAEERRCAVELTRLKQAQNDLARQVIAESAGLKIGEIIGNNHAKPMNGSNGHAPIDQPNWAQVIAETELRFETRFATLKEQLIAQPGEAVATSLSDELVDGLVRQIVLFVREEIKPLKDLVAELEARPSLTYEGVWSATKAYSAGTFVTHGGGLWHCEDTNVGVQPGNGSSAWKLAVKRGRAER